MIVASKGRFDRARTPRQRAADGLPHESTVMTDDFLAMTLDIWRIASESATRVGHPAPFPVELPEQLIRLYTFRDDLVLDPFMGSGSALVAAARLGRRYIGYDLDANYVELARQRVAEALSTVPPESRATADGKAAPKLAEQVLVDAGFTIEERSTRIRRTGVTIDFVATDADGATWYFDVCGSFTSSHGGMLLADTVWKSLGRAHAVRRARGSTPLVLLTSHLPRRPSEGDTALRAAGPEAFFDAIDMLSTESLERLQRYAKGRFTDNPQPGFWTSAELERPTDPRSVVDFRTPTSSQQPRFAFTLDRGRPRPA